MNDVIFSDMAIQRVFERDGVVQIPFLDQAEVDVILSIYQGRAAKNCDLSFYSTMFINDPDHRAKIDADLKKILTSKVNSTINNYRILFSNFIVKEPAADTIVGIHQDWSMTSPEYTSVNIWIPLTDIDDKTGVFYALKGSHHTFHNIRFTPYPDNAYASIEKFIFRHSTPFKLKAGEALIYHGALVHYSDANISERRRIAIGNALIPKDAPALHYYKRHVDRKELELYETDESFYNTFDFFAEPKGVKKIREITDYCGIPGEEDLVSIAD